MQHTFATNQRAKERRKRVITRLKTQLKDGTKSMKAGQGSTKNEFVEFKGKESLTEQDRKRITKEISILETRI